MPKNKSIFTIGHSTRSLEEFTSLLRSFNIEFLADIRSYPGSRRYPYFNKDALQESLPAQHIIYQHFPELGGRRKAMKDSKNTAWRNEAFRGYADYMESMNFETAIAQLEETALQYRTVYMCSEAVWWRCHRSMVSDFLKWKGWDVKHIMGLHKAEEHPYSPAAKIINGKLDYTDHLLF